MKDHERRVAARLGKGIRKQRTHLELSQAELAERLDASPEYVSLLERGSRLPSLGTLAKLADTLGVTMAALLNEHPMLEQRRPGIADALLRAVPGSAMPVVIGMLRGVLDAYRRKQQLKRQPARTARVRRVPRRDR